MTDTPHFIATTDAERQPLLVNLNHVVSISDTGEDGKARIYTTRGGPFLSEEPFTILYEMLSVLCK